MPIVAFVVVEGFQSRGTTVRGRILVQRQALGRGELKSWLRGDDRPLPGRVGALRVPARRAAVALDRTPGSGGRISLLRLGASCVLLLVEAALRSSQTSARLPRAGGVAGGYAFR